MHPYATLCQYDQRSRASASTDVSALEHGDYWRGVGFTLAGQLFVAKMGVVSEISQMPKVTKVPGVRNWVYGVANVRGMLVPVVDLVGMLDLPSKTSSRGRRVLIVEHDEHQTGVVVDSVLGVQQFNASDEQAPVQLDPAVRPYVQSVFVRDGQQWPVFDFKELACSSQFLHIAV